MRKLSGYIEPDEIARYMRESTAFVQHSIIPGCGPEAGDCEGTPVIVLEAMLTGIPVISTRHAGIMEVVEDGCTGLLVEEHDVDGMADAMITLAQADETAREIGERARHVALQRYTMKHYISAIAAVLRTSCS